MHELSVAMGLLDAVEEEAEHHSGRVQAIHLKLGLLSGVVKEALLSAFEMARDGTTLEDVQLLIEEVPVVVYCPTCRAQRAIASVQWFCCPTCDSPTSDVVQGKELELVGLEMA